VANCYFLFIVILELVAVGVGMAIISLIPLLVVVGISMVKDIIEDRARYMSDQEENDR
jgi:inner membrane protein involved in colicin E2 resistance